MKTDPLKNSVKDPDLWKQKAMAFVTRSHRHLWGKNNEDPQIFLYRQNLTNQFVKNMHLGWNKHGQERTMEKWGLERLAPENQPGKLFLPPGIVVPYIVEKKLVSVFIHPLDPSGHTFLVPGSSESSLLLGDPKTTVKTIDGLFEGLRLFQEENTHSLRIRPRLNLSRLNLSRI